MRPAVISDKRHFGSVRATTSTPLLPGGPCLLHQRARKMSDLSHNGLQALAGHRLELDAGALDLVEKAQVLEHGIEGSSQRAHGLGSHLGRRHNGTADFGGGRKEAQYFAR